MFKVGEFSKLTNLTVRALHHYEELEILFPAEIDAVTNYRYYSAEQLRDANQIKNLQEMGLSLKEIKTLLEKDDKEELKAVYESQEIKLAEELETIKKKMTVIKGLKENIAKGNFLEKYHVGLKEIPERKVLSLRRVIPTFYDEQELWTDLYQEFEKQELKSGNPAFWMSIYHDQEYREEEVDVEVQCSILSEAQDCQDVKSFLAKALNVASVTFNGSYEQMPEVTEALALWIEANDYRICGPMLNIYYVSPAQDSNPENWITEAAYVIEKNK